MTARRWSPWAVFALVLAVLGVVAALVRPLAPVLPPGTTDLGRFSEALLADVAAYRDPRLVLRGLLTAFGLLVPVAVAFTPTGRRLVGRLASSRRGWLAAAAVGGGMAGVLQVVQAPVGYVAYRHARAYGFATDTAVSWLRDAAVEAGLAVLIGAVGAVVLRALIVRWPQDWHWRLVPAATLLSALLVTLYPVVVDPLFNRTTPLAAGPVRSAVESVLERAGESDLEILVADASRRTTQANAFVTGLGPSRRVVLYDTLLTYEPDLVAVVVAHELGHRRNGDIWRGVALAGAGILLAALALRAILGSARWRARVGASSAADPRALALAVVVVAVAELVLTPIALVSSRRAEAAADAAAVELSAEPGTLIRVQRQFVVRDLADPDPPAWATLLWGTHPSVERRIRAAVAEAEAAGIDLPALADLEAEEKAVRWRK